MGSGLNISNTPLKFKLEAWRCIKFECEVVKEVMTMKDWIEYKMDWI